MALRLPDAESLTSLGSQAFANEVELQRFFEESVTPLCGLRLVSSSLRGGRRLGHIDSTALDDEGSPVIIEYKWDRVDGDVMQRLARYERWFLNHRELFDAHVLARLNTRASYGAKPRLVAVGYRFHRAAPIEAGSPVLCLRYGYRPDRTVLLQALDEAEVEMASSGQPPPGESKDSYLDEHLKATTPAARKAFQVLRRQLGRGWTD